MSDEMSPEEWETLLREASEADQMGLSSLYEDDETEFDPDAASDSIEPGDWAEEGFIDDEFSDDEPEVTMLDIDGDDIDDGEA